jgi:O-antigen ligase
MLILVVQVIIRHGQYGFTFFHIRKAMAPFFRNHVNYAALISLLLPVAIVSFYLTPRFSPKRKWILVGIVIGLAGWVLAYSRGAWLALPAGGIMVIVLRKKWLVPVLITGGVLILISTAWLITEKRYLRFAPNHDQTYFHTQFRQHLQATFEGKDISTAERWHRWVAGVRMIMHEPITGFGPNSFYRHYQPYTLRAFETWVSNNPEHSTVHNYFLLLAIEQGLVGLLLFLLLIVYMFFQLQDLCRKLQSHFYRSIALTTSAILTIVLVLNLMSDLIETDKIGSVFYSCLGIIILLQQEAARERTDLA